MYYPKDDYHKTYKFKLNNKKMNNLIFLGMVSLFDPPKKGIDETMLRLKAAGIKVVMITGDQDITATAVAR